MKLAGAVGVKIEVKYKAIPGEDMDVEDLEQYFIENDIPYEWDEDELYLIGEADG